MKEFNLINIVFLIVCASCTTESAANEELYSFLSKYWPGFSANWMDWVFFPIAAVCISVAIFGGLYIYRDGWRSLVPKSWRKSDK